MCLFYKCIMYTLSNHKIREEKLKKTNQSCMKGIMKDQCLKWSQ